MSSDVHTDQVEKIASDLRANLRKARAQARAAPGRVTDSSPSSAKDSAAVTTAMIVHELAVLRENSDIARAPFTSHRPVFGRVTIALRNIVRMLMEQLLVRQSVYNSAAVQAMTHLNHTLDLLANDQAQIAQRIAALESAVGSVNRSK